jgi:hypothetical protein
LGFASLPQSTAVPSGSAPTIVRLSRLKNIVFARCFWPSSPCYSYSAVSGPIAVIIFVAVNKLYVRDSLGERKVLPGEAAE